MAACRGRVMAVPASAYRSHAPLTAPTTPPLCTNDAHYTVFVATLCESSVVHENIEVCVWPPQPPGHPTVVRNRITKCPVQACDCGDLPFCWATTLWIHQNYVVPASGTLRGEGGGSHGARVPLEASAPSPVYMVSSFARRVSLSGCRSSAAVRRLQTRFRFSHRTVEADDMITRVNEIRLGLLAVRHLSVIGVWAVLAKFLLT